MKVIIMPMWRCSYFIARFILMLLALILGSLWHFNFRKGGEVAEDAFDRSEWINHPDAFDNDKLEHLACIVLAIVVWVFWIILAVQLWQRFSR